MRRIARVVTLAALLTLVAGCGGEDAPVAAPAPAAPEAPAPLPRFATLADLAAATAAAQRTDKTANLTISSSQGGQHPSSMDGDGALRLDQTGTAMRLTQRLRQAAGGQQTELGLVLLPDAAFVRPPPGGALTLPPGKTWVKLRPGSTDPVAQQVNQLVQAVRDNADPTRSFAQFGDAITIIDTGEDELEGARTMRYKLHVDLSKAAARQPDPALKASFQRSVESGLSGLDYLIWLDAASRLTRVQLDQPLPGNQGSYAVDVRYRDWGQPVDITAPEAGDVVER